MKYTQRRLNDSTPMATVTQCIASWAAFRLRLCVGLRRGAASIIWARQCAVAAARACQQPLGDLLPVEQRGRAESLRLQGSSHPHPHPESLQRWETNARMREGLRRPLVHGRLRTSSSCCRSVRSVIGEAWAMDTRCA